MKSCIVVMMICMLGTRLSAQTDSLVIPESAVVDIQLLIVEAMMNNPELRAALYRMDAEDARASSNGGVEPPRLKYMREMMPGFDWSEAMYSRIELMQMLKWPSKYSAERDLATLQSDHAHHDHLEKVNDVILRLKSAYAELWFIQQNIILERENARLLKQFSDIALTRYGSGTVSRQDVLKGLVEASTIGNEILSLRQQELSTKSMLMALLNRTQRDTIGFAVVSEEVKFDVQLDTLLALAMNTRPMLIHDSLTIDENKAMLTIAKKEYIPDVDVGLEHVNSPATGFTGWSVSATITLPFAPWSSAITSSRVDESSANIRSAAAAYDASKNMVIGAIKDSYFKATTAKQQLDNYRLLILPQAEQALNAALASYENGSADFLMLIDAYRLRVSLTKDYFMTRLRFEQSMALLEQQVGIQNLDLGK